MGVMATGDGVYTVNTRMHSSRMRTARALTTFVKKNWSPPRKMGGTPLKNWMTPPSEKLEEPPPPKNWRNPPRNIGDTPSRGQTHACKLITLPQTSFAGGNNPVGSIAPSQWRF